MKTYPLLTLIADDSDDDRLLFSRAVRSLPEFRLVGVTTDGLETAMYLQGFAAYGNREKYPFPDLILLDYEMPGYNGLEVLALLSQATPRPKVILWSNTIERIDQGLAYELGAAMVCLKPVQVQTVLNALQESQPHSATPRPWIPQNGWRTGLAGATNRLAAIEASL
jgi:CheY-like chemotaxis protein